MTLLSALVVCVGSVKVREITKSLYFCGFRAEGGFSRTGCAESGLGDVTASSGDSRSSFSRKPMGTLAVITARSLLRSTLKLSNKARTSASPPPVLALDSIALNKVRKVPI